MPVTQRVFQNQLHTFGDDTAAVIRHAVQMGYDYIAGQPWSARRAREGTAAGLGVLFNTGADSAKWMRLNAALTTINGRRITASDRANFEKCFCLKNPAATVLTERFKRDPQYPGDTVLFHPNYFSSEALDLLIAYNVELFVQHGGRATHAGVFVDQINAGVSSPYPGPCLNSGRKDFATAADGQLEYIRRLHYAFGAQLRSGNPFRIRNYEGRHAVAPFDLYYNEKGTPATNHVSDFGGMPPGRVAVCLPVDDQLHDNDYPLALRTAGIAMQQKSWFGWYGKVKPSQTSNGVQLLRALPNWDNLVNALVRFWNPTTRIYRTSNNYADPHVAYGYHPTTGQLFVVFADVTGVVWLRPSEEVTAVKRVDALFCETTDGRADLAISGSQVRLKKTANVGKGYILTVA